MNAHSGGEVSIIFIKTASQIWKIQTFDKN